MLPKDRLGQWIVEALHDLGGRGDLISVSKHMWEHHESDLRGSGSGFYTWQYDVRWAATELRLQGVLRPAAESPRGVWELQPSGKVAPPEGR